MVVLANRDHAELRHALMWRVFDAYLGRPPRAWSSELKAMYDSVAERGRSAAAQREQRITGTRPSLALEKYAGAYADSLYGELEVRHEGGKLVLDFGPGRIADLEHWHYDTFRASWRDPELGRTFATFDLGRDGAVRAMQLEGYAGFER
jgi:hypothetical protein